MPRNRRQPSETNVYHVTSRGAGKRILFDDDIDKVRYVSLLRSLADEEGITVFAWCLMDNHSHLLCEASLPSLSSMMLRLNTAYSHSFNGRHGHVGPVFQGRFSSVPIEGDAHFLGTVRYIHLNPKDSCDDPYDYLWSSYRQYAGGKGFCNLDKAIGICGSADALMRFHDVGRDGVDSIDMAQTRPRISDAEARRISIRFYGRSFADEIVEMDKTSRDRALFRLYEAGLSIRQIGRLTGVGNNTIYRAKKRGVERKH